MGFMALLQLLLPRYTALFDPNNVERYRYRRYLYQATEWMQHCLVIANAFVTYFVHSYWRIWSENQRQRKC